MGGGYGWIGDPTAMRLDEALAGVRRGSSSFVRVEKNLLSYCHFKGILKEERGDRPSSCVVCGRLPHRRECCGGGILNQLTLLHLFVQI